MAGATAPAFLFGARRRPLRVLRSSPGGATRRSDSTSVGGPFRFYARCYRFCYSFSTATAVRPLTRLVGDAITLSMVASSAC